MQSRTCTDPRHSTPCQYDNCQACQTECVAPTGKLDPYVMEPVRQAYVEVVGKMWMGGTATYVYDLTDTDLVSLGESFTRESVSKWLKGHSGDFQSIIDYRAVCGQLEVPWALETMGETFNEISR